MSDNATRFGELSAALSESENKKRAALQKSGRLSSRARFEALFDAGSYNEIAGLVSGSEAGDADRLLCAFGAVDGECVYAFSQEFSQDNAAFTAAGAQKLTALYTLAAKRPAPIVGFFDCNGASLPEGLSLMGSLSELIALRTAYAGVAPQIALVAGPCGASLAAFAAGFDLVLMEEQNGELFLNPPGVQRAEGAGTDAGKAAAAAKQGLCARVCRGEAALIAAAKSALSYLPEDSDSAAPQRASADDANRAAHCFDKGCPDAETMLDDLFDAQRRFSLWEDFAPEAKTGFAALAGVSCGYLAADGSALTRAAAEKLSRMIELCDRFELPLISFVNTPSFSAAEEAAHGFADRLSHLAQTYADADIPMLTLYCGCAFGPALSCIGTKALGADFVFALPDAVISLLAPDSAVAFSESDKLKGSENPIAGRAALIETYRTDEASPVHAAKAGLVDDILNPQEVRARLAFCLNMLTFS